MSYREDLDPDGVHADQLIDNARDRDHLERSRGAKTTPPPWRNSNTDEELGCEPEASEE